MPGGDGTGPAGLGPMTERAAGYCTGYPVPVYMNPIPGRSFSYSNLIPAYSTAPNAPAPVPYGYRFPYAWFRGGRFARGFCRDRRGWR